MLLALLHRWMHRPNRRLPLSLRTRRHPWLLERLEDRAVPAIAFATSLDPTDPPTPLAAGQSTTDVKVWSDTGALLGTIPNVFPGEAGGCHVAVGDITGDGIPDIVVGAGVSNGSDGTQGALVRVFDGGALLGGIIRSLGEFKAYNDNVTSPHLGGAFVAVGDTNGDLRGDIITGAADGNHTFGAVPHVKVFSGASANLNQPTVLSSFFAYVDPAGNFFGGGVNVAASDLGGDNASPPSAPGTRFGKAEIVTGVGFGGGPHVKVFDTHSNPVVAQQIASFFAFDPSFTGGVNVAAGFVTNNRDNQGFIYADIVASPGNIYQFVVNPTTGRPEIIRDAGGRPIIVTPPGGVEPPTRVFRLFDGNNTDPSVGSLFLYYAAASFNPYPTGFFGGIRVTTAYITTPPPFGTGTAPGNTQPDPTSTITEDIITVPGISGHPQIKVFRGQSVPETAPPAPLPTFTPIELTNPPTAYPFLAYDFNATTGVAIG